MKAPAAPIDEPHVMELARSLDCLTEAEFQALGNLTAGTVQSWRKRGTGPAYCRLGNRFYYPRVAVADFMAKQLREPRDQGRAKDLL